MKEYSPFMYLMFPFCWLIGFTTSQTIQDVKDLKSYLFINNSYDPAIRPSNNQTEPIYIFTSFRLVAIHDLNEVHESLKTTGTLILDWKDDSLVWNPDSFNGITELNIPQNDIWKPDIALKNSLHKYKQLGDESLLIYVDNNGSVNWYPIEVFLSTCAVDVSYFPNDVQTCTLTFVAWSYGISEVIIEGIADANLLIDYTPNSAWEVIDIHSYSRNTTLDSEINFEFKLKRKPVYSIITLIFPALVLYILNLFVFALPSDSGEKSGFAVTVFLSFCVFLTIMESSFPHNAEIIPYYSIFVIAGTVQSTTITIVTLVMIRCASFGEKSEAPAWLVAFVKCVTCKCLRGRMRRSRKITMQSPSDVDPEHAVNDLEQNSAKHLQGNKNNNYTWKNCMDILDVFLFCFFVLTFLITTLVYFIIIGS